MLIPCPAEETHLQQCVRDSLSVFLYDNAKWLGERLVALSASEVRSTSTDPDFYHGASCPALTGASFHLQSNVYLLAQCYFQANQAYRAYHLLKQTGRATWRQAELDAFSNRPCKFCGCHA